MKRYYPQKSDIPLVIFAGGKSSRMGEDKALLPFDSYPTLTQYQLERFKPYFKDIYISCKSKDKFNFEASFIEDFTNEKSSPFIGLISAFEKLKDSYIFVLSVDAPFFQYEDFLRLYHEIKNNPDAIIARTKNSYQPLCAIYKRTILPHLKVLDKKKLYKFIHLYDKIRVKYVDFEDEDSFTNLNYKEDYQKAIKKMKKDRK